MNRLSKARPSVPLLVLSLCLIAALTASPATAQEFSEDFNREGCTFTTTGSNPYYMLWPGLVLVIEGDEEDDGETITIRHRITVTEDTQLIDGVLTRVVEEYETEDDELVEISLNFIAQCRETGDVWYFGEDVEDYEDGELVGREGEWRVGVNGAKPGILMPGSPIVGARFFEEIAANDEALDRAEITSIGGNLTVPLGTYSDILVTENTSPLDPGDVDEKVYAPGVGIIKDETLELISMTLPACIPDETTHCLSDGRFEVKADWTTPSGDEGDGMAILASADSGEFWFFNEDNTELIVKVLDACNVAGAEGFWVFAGGLTDLEVTIEVRDTQTGRLVEYDNDPRTPFATVRDFASFTDCP